MVVSAVLSALEGFLEQLGLSKAGDRLNLVAFCKTTNERPEKSQEKKKALLEAFLSRKKMKKPMSVKQVKRRKRKSKVSKCILAGNTSENKMIRMSLSLYRREVTIEQLMCRLL